MNDFHYLNMLIYSSASASLFAWTFTIVASQMFQVEHRSNQTTGFIVSVLINSQGAVVVAMLPLAYELGIAGPVLLGVLPSVYGYFFIPNYPSDIATVNFDRSGTTVIGKYLLNHSFMMPGLICVAVSTVIGYLMTNVFFSGYFASFVQ